MFVWVIEYFVGDVDFFEFCLCSFVWVDVGM